MREKFNLPEFKTINYVLNVEIGKYEKQPERIPFNKLPFELKVETTIDEKIKRNGANEIITAGIKGGQRMFFSGLIAVPKFPNWFYGNDYEIKNGKKKNSLVVFHFANNNRELVIYYFNNYYKDSRVERESLVVRLIKFIQSIM
jgi:hypothetical protein